MAPLFILTKAQARGGLIYFLFSPTSLAFGWIFLLIYK
jgi:hypothetical protein